MHSIDKDLHIIYVFLERLCIPLKTNFAAWTGKMLLFVTQDNIFWNGCSCVFLFSFSLFSGSQMRWFWPIIAKIKRERVVSLTGPQCCYNAIIFPSVFLYALLNRYFSRFTPLNNRQNSFTPRSLTILFFQSLVWLVLSHLSRAVSDKTAFMLCWQVVDKLFSPRAS